MKQYNLTIKGMGSQHCVGVVTKIISGFDGASIDTIEIGKATITLDETKVWVIKLNNKKLKTWKH